MKNQTQNYFNNSIKLLMNLRTYYTLIDSVLTKLLVREVYCNTKKDIIRYKFQIEKEQERQIKELSFKLGDEQLFYSSVSDYEKGVLTSKHFNFESYFKDENGNIYFEEYYFDNNKKIEKNRYYPTEFIDGKFTFPKLFFSSPTELINYYGYQKEKEGKVITVGGYGELMQMSEQQKTSINKLYNILKECKDRNISLVYTEGKLKAYNNKYCILNIDNEEEEHGYLPFDFITEDLDFTDIFETYESGIFIKRK